MAKITFIGAGSTVFAKNLMGDILGLVDRLGFTPDGLIGSLVRAWPLMPLLLVGAVVAAWWRQRLIAIAVGVVGGLYAGALGAVVAVSVPDRRSISVDRAPWVTALGGGLVVLGSLALCFVRVPSADAHSR